MKKIQGQKKIQVILEGQEIYLKDREMDFEGYTYKIQLICILIWTLLYALVASYKLSHFITLAQ